VSDSPTQDGGGGKPTVLLTNDDGWAAPGLLALARVLSSFADLVVVAPRREQSGVGHGITIHEKIDVERATMDGAREAYMVDGTPADCAKLGIRALFADRPPAFVVSGMNNGPNVGVNVLYSGTVGAALEATVNGVPAIAVSKEFGDSLSFDDAAGAVSGLLQRIIARGLPLWRVLNINVPGRPAAQIAGVRVTRHGISGFDESYREVDAAGGEGTRRFALEGVMTLRDNDGRTDAEALRDGYISVTPLGLDLTSRAARSDGLAEWSWVAG
jgi:5'-nucleotidase